MGEVIGVLILIAIAIYKISGQKKQPPAARKSRPPRPPRMWTEPSPMNAVPEDMTPEEMQSEDMTPEDMRPLEAEESAQETMEGLSVAQTPGHEHHDPTEGSIDLPEGSQEGTSQWTEKPRAQAEPVKARAPRQSRKRISPEEMRRAVVLSEVLDKPLALRPRRKVWGFLPLSGFGQGKFSRTPGNPLTIFGACRNMYPQRNTPLWRAHEED